MRRFSITNLCGLRLHLNNPQRGINRRIHHGTAAADSDGCLRPLPPFAAPLPPALGQEVTPTLRRNTWFKLGRRTPTLVLLDGKI